MTSRIRKNSKRLKRSIKKKKYIGGITSMSGLHAFFVNKAKWIKLFGEVEKDKDAPKIKDIKDNLKGKGYYINPYSVLKPLGGVLKLNKLSQFINILLFIACKNNKIFVFIRKIPNMRDAVRVK